MDESSELELDPPITDLTTLVRTILDECLDYQHWEDAPNALEKIRGAYWHLKGRIESLQGFFPPVGQLPGDGQTRWRDLQEAKNRMTEADQTGFHRALDRLIEWLVVYFEPTAPQDTPTPLSDLTETEREVFAVVTDMPTKGLQISERCGRTYEAVRQILPRLRRYGLVKTAAEGGYVRV